MMTVEQFFNTLMEGDAPGSDEENLYVSIRKNTDNTVVCYGRMKEFFDTCKAGRLDKVGHPCVVRLSQWNIVSFNRIKPDDYRSNMPEYNWPIELRII